MYVRVVCCLVALTCGFPASAAYKNLVASADGSKLYFTPDAGLYTAESTGSPLSSIQLIPVTVRDYDAAGAVTTTGTYGEKYCGVAGSTCFLRPPCSATFEVKGPSFDLVKNVWRTFARMDRGGKVVWVEQDASCGGLGVLVPAPLNGLYGVTSLNEIAPANGARLATRRFGRRAITDRGTALTFAGAQLQWLDSNGARQVRHVFGAYEAVTDATGDNIVYVDGEVGGLHWIASGVDEELGLMGSAPLLSDDGKTLYFLSQENRLQAYDRASRGVRRIGDEAYMEFTTGGPYAFAVTTGNKLVRVELSGGVSTTLAEPLPEITDAFAPRLTNSITCPLVCYGTPPSWFIVSNSMLLIFEGRWLDTPAWRFRTGTTDLPLQVVSSTEAFVQIPQALERTGNLQDAEIYKSGSPAKITFKLQVQDQVAACLGTLNQNFSQIVSSVTPARPGEVVHVFLTGLPARERIADGVPNPTDRLIPLAAPTLADPDALQLLFAGLAPGLIGIQQMDFRVVRASDRPLFSDVNQYACGPIPVVP